MTRNEIGKAYTVVQGYIRSPGKFEGCVLCAPHFYDLWNEGMQTENLDLPDDTVVGVFFVDKEDQAEFPELEHTSVVAIANDDNGFCHLKEFGSVAEYEKWAAIILGEN